jgi:hypothetical protein
MTCNEYHTPNSPNDNIIIPMSNKSEKNLANYRWMHSNYLKQSHASGDLDPRSLGSLDNVAQCSRSARKSPLVWH